MNVGSTSTVEVALWSDLLQSVIGLGADFS